MTIDATLNKRIDRLVRKHQKMRRNGVVHRVGRDGLIRSRPRLVRPNVPLRGIAVILMLFMAFKAVLFAQMGSGNYALMIEELRGGNEVQQAGAWLLQEEAVTQTLGGYLTRHFF
ncbi:MAG: hypothetical protein AAGL89_06710 [Pseudomonadota bacterium]